MRKALLSTCAAALLAASASTAFAAANPFEDVPEGHWAYDAVAQLAADGVIEGYGDGTYRGDPKITRFEMAKMIARAMANGGGDRATLDKLAAEFADELKQLGVRVAALEKKVDNVKFNGTVRYRYITERGMDEGFPLRTAVQYLTLRLEPSMQINEHWTGYARIDYNNDMNSAGNTDGNTRIAPDPAMAVTEGNGLPGLRVERIWVQGDYDHLHILLGKLPYISNIDGGMLFDDNVSGGQVTFGNKVKMTLTGGRSKWFDGAQINADFDPQPEAGGGEPEQAYSGTGNYFSAEMYNDRADKWTWGVGFHHWGNGAALGQEIGTSSVNIWDLGLGYKFNKNLSLHGAYAWTTSPQQEAADPATPLGPGHGEQSIAASAKRAWSIELNYKKANPADKGSWGAFLAYRHLGSFAVVVPTYDAIAASEKGVEVGVDYVFAKNIMGTVKYFFGKKLDDEYSAENEASQLSQYRLFTELNFFF